MKDFNVMKAITLACAGVLVLTAGPVAAQQAPPVEFGDLVILYREDSGVPILTADGVEGPNTGLCQQPVAFNAADPADLCPDTCVVPSVPAGAEVVDVDQATCAVVSGCEACTQEVDFGRVNEARSSDEVFDSQLQDVVVNLATSDCVVSLDPAGRLVTGKLVVDNPDPEPDVFSTSAIDSPLQNLAIYRQLIQTGSLGIPLPGDVLDTAARGLGAASDKTGEVNVDLVAYLNLIMGLSDHATTTILDPKICIQVREELQGSVQLVQKCFLDYSAYAYDRQLNFEGDGLEDQPLPNPPYIPGAPETPVAGWFEYLDVLDPAVPSFRIVQGPILEAVFPDTPFVEFEGVDIGAFARAADDTRAVIAFMHNWAVPADFETAVPCVAQEGITYDVSISPVSGLQVPKNYVDGTLREFTVTVANGGPDDATGVVAVTAVARNGEEAGSWTFAFAEDDPLLAGTSRSWTEVFQVRLDETTVIDWTAIAEAPYDVNTSNNTVTATTSVRATGGGGGGGH